MTLLHNSCNITNTCRINRFMFFIAKILIIKFILTINDDNHNHSYYCQAFSTTINTKYRNINEMRSSSLELTRRHQRHQQQIKNKTILFNSKKESDNDKTNMMEKTTPYLTVMVPLLMVYISNQWSRSSIYYLVNFSPGATAATAINVDLNFSETEYGLLASIGFTVLYATASLFAGSISDSYNRKTITYLSCTSWTIATAFTAIATSYNDVLLARIFMGLSCAFTTPAAYTIIRDVFPKDQAAFASSIFFQCYLCCWFFI